jgi:glycosyltransferase involved in cell wall biosynthesis
VVKISATICTHNRARLLDEALASLAAQSLPAGEYEVIVVNNGSSDNTEEVIAKWAGQLPGFRYCCEPKVGVSYARNRAVAEAQAPIVACLDDDARACYEWLDWMGRAFETTLRPAVVGGPVSLVWEGGHPPKWMSRHLMEALSYVEYGSLPKLVRHVNGCNMALDKSVLQAYGGFKVHLGRRGSSLLSSEESDFMWWLRANNYPIYYEPRAQAHQYIVKRRQTAAHMLRVYYGLGFSDGLRDGRDHRLYSMSQSAKRFRARLSAGIKDERPGLLSALMIATCEVALQMGFIAAQISPKLST